MRPVLFFVCVNVCIHCAIQCAHGTPENTCRGIMLEMSVSECVSECVVTDGVCVRVTNIGHVISHIHDTPARHHEIQEGPQETRMGCLCVDVCVCVCEFKSENFYKFDWRK